MMPFTKFGQIARLLTFGCAWLLAMACAAQAETIVSSLSNTGVLVNVAQPGVWTSSPFRTDSRAWTLTSVTVLLAGGAPNSSEATVRLFADGVGRPGAAIANLGTQNITNELPYIFAPVDNVTLNPSTTYWLGVGNLTTNGGLNLGSLQHTQLVYTGVPGATMAHSLSSGFSTNNNPPSGWSVSASGVALLFAVDGTTGTTSAAPSLTIFTTNATNYFVGWPTSATGYTLEHAPSLPATVWTPFTNAPAIIAGQFAQPIDVMGPKRFYRLRR